MRIRYQIRLYSVVLGLLWLLPLSVSAQRQKSKLELQTDSLSQELRSAGVDTFCVYEDYCVGCRAGSPCDTKGLFIPTYLFWKKSGHSYRRYLDNCTLGEAQEVKAVFWKYFDRFRSEIQAEEIKRFHIMNEGKASRVFRNHGNHASFSIITQKDTTDQYFDYFSLAKFYRFSKKKKYNIYYQQNRKTHIYKLYKLLSEAAAADPKLPLARVSAAQ
ncbi:hypothetical protein [Hymenobacter guriensis]|uniref:Uncharacterized protein n=1 Tax=Hymenobacter guriensis TaxID=2793065 RepID=A0ABS0L935_9BACT|nr:hypothetical protein [Hymenobacter guriensis]MBG8555947.1 hypothetical protein [Hymenobacter guriensis]